MKRREFITLVGGSAVGWPLGAEAQQPAVPVIGFLRSASAEGSKELLAALREGLKEVGYVDRQNVTIEPRFAENHPEHLRGIVTDLIRQPVAVIVGNTPAALAAKAVTTTIPIVFVTGGDVVREGFVDSLNRPGGNVTGVSFLSATTAAKRLELLREMVPAVAKIAVIVNDNPDAVSIGNEIRSAAHAFGLRVVVINANSAREIDEAFASFVQQRVDALVAAGGAFFFGRRDQLIGLAARYRIPATYSAREFTEAGGLMSYAGSISDAYRQAGTLTGKILNGGKPKDLPVQQSVKIELVINLKTARALGLTVPNTLLVAADEVIE